MLFLLQLPEITPPAWLAPPLLPSVSWSPSRWPWLQASTPWCCFHPSYSHLKPDSSKSPNIAPSSLSDHNISHLHSLMFLHLCPCPSNSSTLSVPSPNFSLNKSNFPMSPRAPSAWHLPLSCQHLQFYALWPWTTNLKLDQCNPLPDPLVPAVLENTG